MPEHRFVLRRCGLLAAAMTIAGCTPDTTPYDSEPANITASSLSDEEAVGILYVANTLSLEKLDDVVGLDRRAADNIVAHRDESKFETIEELDAVPYVTSKALGLLRDYAIRHGYVEGFEPAPACLLISEYAEGSGSYNKAIEIWNCGDEPVALERHALCLVRNDDIWCTLRAAFTETDLDPGDTWVVCRTTGGTFNDPLQSLRDRCDQEMPGVVNMSGDDRFAVLDVDGTVLDAFGRLFKRPSTPIWADAVFRRCDLEPYLGKETFVAEDHYTRHSRNTHAGLGQPPTDGCE